MGNSPAVLQAFAQFNGAMGTAKLNAKVREQIALLTAENNACTYCLSAHTALGKMAGLTQDQMNGARHGESGDPKTLAALTFAQAVIDSRGGVSDRDVQTVRSAGHSDAEIAEIVGAVALNVFTNLFNRAFAVDVDAGLFLLDRDEATVVTARTTPARATEDFLRSFARPGRARNIPSLRPPPRGGTALSSERPCAMTRNRSAALVASVSVLLAGGSVGGQTNVRTVTEIGDPAPGFPAGDLLQDFAAHPDVQQVTASAGPPPAEVDADGNVSFHAFVGPVLPPSTGPSAFFKVLDGTLALVVRTDDPAPGTGTFFTGPNFFASPPTPGIADGRATFLFGAGDEFDPDLGIWSDRQGPLELVVIEGDNLPGMPPAGELSDFVNILRFRTRGNTVILAGGVANSGSPDLHPAGLWRNAAGSFDLLVITELPAPGMPPGVVFGESSQTQLLGPVGFFTLGSQDRAAFTGFVKGPGITAANNEGIWVETESGVELFLAEGTPVPPGHFPPGTTFSSPSTTDAAFTTSVVSFIRLNDNGALLFHAVVDPPGSDPRVPTLWTTRNGELELVFRGRNRGVAGSVPGDAAPGVPGGTFFFPSLHFLNDRGDIAVLGRVETNNNLFDDIIGFWVDRGDGFVLVGVEEGPVPGVPGGTFLPEINGVRSVEFVSLEDDGSVLFRGRYFDAAGDIQFGMFRHGPDDVGEQILALGDDLLVDGRELRTVQGFRPGTGTTGAGEKIMEISFTDGSSGLYMFPIDPPCLGDIDGNGTVEVVDFLALLQAWGPNPGHPADIDGNGVVDTVDFLALLNHWGACP